MSGASLAERFAAGGNNFDLIRIGAALMVLGSHAYVLTGHADAEPVARLLRHGIDGGGLAVATFFVLSGFLLAGSVERRGARGYVWARALRIGPGLLGVVLLQAFLLGPVFTGLPVRAYGADPALWTGLARSLLFSPPLGLPGVFEHSPVPLAVNGSLWTLRIEVLCYAGLLGLSRAGLLRRGWVLLPLAAGWGLLGAVGGARAGWLPAEWASLRVAAPVDCALHFIMGVAASVYAARIPHWAGLAGAGLAGSALALLGLGMGTPGAPVAIHLAVPCLVLWLGLCRPVLPGMADISYGAYLYAFPVQQALVACVPGLGPPALAAGALGPTLLLAGLSRVLIEQPALRLRPAGPGAR